MTELQAAFGRKPTHDEQARFFTEHMPRYALRMAPDGEFATALEIGIEQVGRLYHEQDPLRGQQVEAEIVHDINKLFAKRAVPYHVDAQRLTVEWHGDQTMHKAVIEPAVNALGDTRLEGARAEFEDALAKLRAGTPKDREDAIEEAAKPVESAMKVLCAERNLSLPKPPTAQRLFDALADDKSGAAVVPKHTDKLITAPARIRNAEGGHGAGHSPRQTLPDIAEAAAHGAAVAITYLAGKLP